jgi:hypothetical protein
LILTSRRLLGDLRAGSPRFVRLWDEGKVAGRRSSRKTIHHPELGRLTLDCDVLHVPDLDQRLIVYSAAAGTPEADALALLQVIGLENLTPDANVGVSAGVDASPDPI